jgi:Ala-tRNA(Pro) deacylase
MERANAQDVYALLQTLGMPFTHTAHAEAHTMEDLVQVEETLGAPFCKNLFLTNRQKTEFILLLIRGDKRFRTAEVSRRLGRSRLSFGEEDTLFELLGVHPGAITPMGLVFDTEHKVQLVMDRETKEQEYFCCHPCRNNGTLKMKTADVLNVFLKHTGHEPMTVDLPRYTEEAQ